MLDVTNQAANLSLSTENTQAKGGDQRPQTARPSRDTENNSQRANANRPATAKLKTAATLLGAAKRGVTKAGVAGTKAAPKRPGAAGTLSSR